MTIRKAAACGGPIAEGRIERSETALVVRKTAVRERGHAMGAEVRRQAQRVEVTVGLRDDQTERLGITKGVSAGDLLLVGAAQGMTPDTPLRVKAQAASSN